MSTPENEFDAAKAVVDQLKGMDKQHQERILRWVSESLNLDLGKAPKSELPRTTHESLASPYAHLSMQASPTMTRSLDIKSFVDSKQPKSDVQFAVVVAYYYRFEATEQMDSINAKMLQEAARLASRRRPPNPLKTLSNAKQLGYLDSVDRGQFRVNSVGENLVAMTLPGVEQAGGSIGRKRKSKNSKAKK